MSIISRNLITYVDYERCLLNSQIYIILFKLKKLLTTRFKSSSKWEWSTQINPDEIRKGIMVKMPCDLYKGLINL